MDSIDGRKSQTGWASTVRLIATTAIATTFLVVPASGAVADPGDGSVGGTIAVPDGHDVTGVDVYLASSDGSSVVAGPTNPDGAGAYAFASLADGDYTVFAEAPGDTLAWQWSGGGRDAGEASTVTVSGGAATTGVDLSLVVGASISGTITVPGGHSPEDSAAFADRPSGSAAVAPPGTETAGGQYTAALADGSYTISGLADLSYLMRFTTMGGALASQYYDGVYTSGAATTLSPSTGEAVTGIDATLEESGLLRVAGTFKDANSSLCYAYHNADSSVTGSACTDAGTTEDSRTVPPGDYIVSAYESNATHGDTPTLWWNATATNETVEANATAFTPDPVSASDPAAAAFDFTGLAFPDETPATGSIAFDLTNWSDGSPATGGCMQVYDNAETLVGEDCTGDAGTYVVKGLDDGDYRVKLSAFDGAAPNQWYWRTYMFSYATPVTIVAGAAFAENYLLLEPRSIVGSVEGWEGGALTGGYVEVWDQDRTYPNSETPLSRVAVAVDGSFATDGVSCARCEVRYTGFDGLADEWFNDPAYFGKTVYTSSQYPMRILTTRLDQPEGFLTGTIAVPSNFSSTDVCVLLYQGTQHGRLLDSVCGSPGDTFEFGRLAASYSICVADTGDPSAGCGGTEYPWAFYGGETTGSYVIGVGSGETVPISLEFGGTIEASPVDVFGAPVLGGCMDVYSANEGTLVGTDCSGTDGTYSVDVGVDDWQIVGSYKLRFRDFPGYVDQWYSGASDLASAKAFYPARGLTVVASDAILRSSSTSGSIAFHVTDWGTGADATGGCMRVYDEDDTQVGEDCVGADSVYEVTGLGDGFYRVLFAGFNGAAPTQWYGPSSSFASATPIVIGTDVDFAGDATMLQPYSIAGKVVDADGEPLTGGFAEIWQYDNTSAPTVRVAVDANGFYSTGTLPTTTSNKYEVRLTGFDGLADQWIRSTYPYYFYLSSDSPAAHTTTLSASEGFITGTIVAPEAFTSSIVCVVLYRAGGSSYQRPLERRCGERGGTFEFGGLATSNYALCVADTDDPTAICSGSSPKWDFYGQIAATSGETTTVVIAFGGAITSTPVIDGGGSLSGGCMDVYEGTSGPLVASDCDPVDGTFTVDVGNDSETVSGKAYHVEFRDFVGGADAWYDNDATRATSSNVVVRGGATVVLDMTLAPWGSIEGTITLAEGASADAGCAGVGSTEGESFWDWACADPDTGEYHVDVPPGDYYVEFFAETSDVATEFYNDVTSSSEATIVAVASGETVVVDAGLANAGYIAGDIALSNESPAAGACVEAYNEAGHFVDMRCADDSGHYVLDSLPAGTYYLLFDGYDVWASEWYDNAQMMVEATPVTVTAGDTAYADAELDHVGTISGTVKGKFGSTYGVVISGWVYAFAYSEGQYVLVDKVYSDSGGEYSLTLPPGQYRLLYQGFGTDLPWAALADTWSGGATTLESAKTVAVVAGSDTTENVTLYEGVVTSVRLREYGKFNDLVEEGCVYVTDAASNLIDYGCAPTGGHPFVLRPNTYVYMYFDGGIATYGNEIPPQWIGHSTNLSGSTYYRVPTSDATFTFDLSPAGAFSGMVVPSGVTDGWVEAYKTGNGAYQGWAPVASDGTYSFDALLAGTGYKFIFKGFTGSSNVWVTNSPTYFGAIGYAVSTSYTSSGVDLPITAKTLPTVTLSVEGVISGVMAAPSSTSVTDACVTAWWKADTYYVNQVCGPVGEPFELHNLPAGTYVLEFSDDAGRMAFFGGSTWDTATVVTVVSGETTELVQTVVTATGGGDYVAGSAANVSFAVDPASSGTAALWYRTGDGAWKKASSTVSIKNGVGAVTVHPSGTRSYRIVYKGVQSNAVTYESIVPSVALFSPDSYAPGSAVTLEFSTDPAMTGSGELWYRTDGGSWRKASTTVSVSAGTGTKTVHPSGVREYKVVFGGGESNVVTLTPILPDVTLSAPETYSPGSAVSLEFSVDPSMTGSGQLWYRTDGGSWHKASTTVSVSAGTGTKTVHPKGTREYKVVFGGGESNVVTLTPILPDVTLSAPETYSPGSAVSLEFSVDPSMTGSGQLWYRTDGGSWRKASTTVSVSAGAGTKTVHPKGTREYKVIFGGGESNVVTLTPILPDVTLSAPETYSPGSAVSLEFSVDPSMTGSGQLWYRTDGGSWRKASTTVSVSAGTGTKTVHPKGTREYKVVFGGGESNVVTLTPILPDVTLSAPETYIPGDAVTLEIGVDPAVSGSGELWYRTDGGSWRKSSRALDIVDGAASTVVHPSGVRDYRVVLGSAESNTVTLTPATA